MKHITIDDQDERVRQFIRSLPIEPDGVELELAGQVVCKVISSHQLSDGERDAVLKRGWELIERARQRNQGVPAKIIEREVRQAVNEVRGRTQEQ
jgi:hypothetical protein